MNGELDKISVIEGLFDKKRIAVLRVFMSAPEKKFYLREVSRLSNVPVATTYRTIKLLANLGLVIEEKISRFKLFRLNEGESTKFLSSFLKEQPLIIDLFVDLVKSLEGVDKIIQHGKAETNKANLLIVGNNVSQGEVKRICAEIMEQYNFKISSLTLAPEQYEQMSSMGLYPGAKKTLFKN